jgi:hypothetical protein
VCPGPDLRDTLPPYCTSRPSVKQSPGPALLDTLPAYCNPPTTKQSPGLAPPDTLLFHRTNVPLLRCKLPSSLRPVHSLLLVQQYPRPCLPSAPLLCMHYSRSSLSSFLPCSTSFSLPSPSPSTALAIGFSFDVARRRLNEQHSLILVKCPQCMG